MVDFYRIIFSSHELKMCLWDLSDYAKSKYLFELIHDEVCKTKQKKNLLRNFKLLVKEPWLSCFSNVPNFFIATPIKILCKKRQRFMFCRKLFLPGVHKYQEIYYTNRFKLRVKRNIKLNIMYGSFLEFPRTKYNFG